MAGKKFGAVQAMKSPSVALVGGGWGQNVGNAFFNVGGKWVLDEVFGGGEVGFIQDQPGYRTFHDQTKGNPKNDVQYLKYLDVKYIVLQGPLLTATFSALWRDTIDALKSRGVKVILLGAAFFKFRDEEFEAAKAFVQYICPAAIVTRDSVSYNVIKEWGLNSPLYDGIDSAFFAPKAYLPVANVLDDYYAFCFDRYPEPTIEINSDDKDKLVDCEFELSGDSWKLTRPRLVDRLAHASKVKAYLGHLLDRRSLPTHVNGRIVVRPEHRTNPHMTYKIYQHPNALAWDEPWTYFSVYSGASLTLSDRVHACVATLAYGRPAMLFTPSRRAALFERVGAQDIRRRPITLSEDYLEEERANEINWLRKVLS